MRLARLLRIIAVLAMIVAIFTHRSGSSAARQATTPAAGHNRLAGEPSPYLQQHAGNPVDWYPWGDAAFARARAEGKPILLSIGYATCHWCHVMAEESFEDSVIAELMNRRYVAIKVDREQRPDIDAVYIEAVQAMTGRGGWPLTVWLTPDGKPFFGGTYFPPRAGVRGSRVGFQELLEQLADTYQQDPVAIEQKSTSVAQVVAARLDPPAGTGLPPTSALRAAVDALRKTYDREHGGFGAAPKFPRPSQLDILLRWHRRTGDADARAMVVHTIDAISRGGITDQLGGGFHRYATDDAWQVPHFEKMLYDNAQLIVAMLPTFRDPGNPEASQAVLQAIDWLRGEMRDTSGAFWSAMDADHPLGEGRYYTWTQAEVDEAVDDHTRPLFNAFYGITAAGNFEGANVLHIPRPLRDVAASMKIEEMLFRMTIRPMVGRLRFVRRRRGLPAIDRKVVTAWNGLAVSAFAQQGQMSSSAPSVAVAVRAAEATLGMRRDGRLVRSSFAGKLSGTAVLEDYAFLIAGLLDLFEATHDPRWLREAIALQAQLDAHYWDATAGGYFRTADDAEPLLAREKPWYDGAEPSGNGVAALNLLRLHELTGTPQLRERAEGILRAFAPMLAQSPAGAPVLLAALDFATDRAKQIVIVARDAAGAQPFSSILAQTYLPNHVLVVVTEGSPQAAELAALVPVAADKTTRDGQATAYVCEGRVCRLPTTDPKAFAAEIARVEPIP